MAQDAKATLIGQRGLRTRLCKTGTTSFAYDALDRMTEETLPGNRVLKHTYDEAGNRTSLTAPEGENTSYAADPPAGTLGGVLHEGYGGA